MSMRLNVIVLVFCLFCGVVSCASSHMGMSRADIEDVYMTQTVLERGDYQLIKLILPNKFDRLLITKGGKVISEFQSRELEKAVRSFDLMSK
jgi:hypothetical protein